MDAIGVDATRYYLVQRSHDQTMDIDLELAREHSQKNPVYYVQYAHARIASIMRRAGAEGGEAEPVEGHVPAAEEAVLIRRLAEFPAVGAAAADMRAPHRIVAYATDLAADFHVFYRECSVLERAGSGHPHKPPGAVPCRARGPRAVARPHRRVGAGGDVTDGLIAAARPLQGELAG